ncbi:MAG: GNAT family N-acetyltransferase [Vicinamibacterales bacterium]
MSALSLQPATEAQISAILDDTWSVWGEGLDRASYVRWNQATLRTPWARERLRLLVLADGDGHVHASVKRYRFDAVLDGTAVRLCGLGAVHTPAALRGRGYASMLVEQLLEQERQAGVRLAGLFSEIGPSFYERLGFEAVALDEVTLAVDHTGGAPAMLVRAGAERDLLDIAAMHGTRAGSARFALQKDAAWIHHALVRKRLLAGLGPPGLRQLEFFVAEEGASAVAFVVLSVNRHGWTIEDAGDRDPAGARLGAMLESLVARDPRARPAVIKAWWPAGFPVPPQLRIAERGRAVGSLLMLRSLDEATVPTLRPGEAFYWHGDSF